MRKIPHLACVFFLALVLFSVPTLSASEPPQEFMRFPVGTWWKYKIQSGEEVLLAVEAIQDQKLVIRKYINNKDAGSYIIHEDTSGIYLDEIADKETTLRWIPALQLSPNGPTTTQRTHKYSFVNDKFVESKVLFYTHQTVGESIISVPFANRIPTRRVEAQSRSVTETTTSTLWFSETIGLIRVEMSVMKDGKLDHYFFMELVDHGKPNNK